MSQSELHQEPLLADLRQLEQHLERIFVSLGLKEAFAQTQSWARATADTVAEEVRGLDAQQVRLGVRLLSHLFFATNVAEQAHRIRRRRAHREAATSPQSGGLRDVFARLKKGGTRAEEVLAAWQQLGLATVLTAHPTEPSRRTLLRKEERLLAHLVAGGAPKRLVDEEAHRNEAITRELALAWQTDELPGAPSVSNEAEHVIYHLASVLYDVVPAITEGMADAFAEVFSQSVGEEVLARPALTFGSWVGGDMDGNPNVGAETILDSLTRARRALLANYRRELTRLLDSFSQSDVHGIVVDQTTTRLDTARSLCSEVVVPPRHAAMPYRQLLHYMIARIDGIEHKTTSAYGEPQELLADIQALRDDVAASAPNLAIERPLTRMLRRVETFGLHLATLDIRQDALVHRQAVAALLGEPDFVDWPVFRRCERLAAALEQPSDARQLLQQRKLNEQTEQNEQQKLLIRCVAVMRAIAEARQRFGPRAIGPYIISMAQDVDDVLAVLLLARAAGVVDEKDNVQLDVSPLFETVPDLERAGATLASMFEHPHYRAHLKARGNKQHVMLGYSDSNKASGIAASRWALQQAQRMLSAVAKNFGIQLVLFHGRGGTASRGGSRPRDAIFALPPGVVRGELRETVQGESIHHNFGHEQLALRSLELMGGAVIERLTHKAEPHTPEGYLAAMATCAGASQEAYQSLVQHPDFFAFFTAATPIDAIGQLKIGSRPSARRAQRALSDLRAIPWVFSWTQCRLLVPNWFGLGAGLRAMREEFGFEQVREMHKKWPFFATLMHDASIGLSIADLQIAKIYASLAGPAADQLWPQLEHAYREASEEVLLACEKDHLLDGDPMLKSALKRRNPQVRPLHALQVELLMRWRKSERQDKDVEQALLMSVKGIARGLSATG